MSYIRPIPATPKKNDTEAPKAGRTDDKPPTATKAKPKPPHKAKR
jgi:hypothetical protein